MLTEKHLHAVFVNGIISMKNKKPLSHDLSRKKKRAVHKPNDRESALCKIAGAKMRSAF